MCGIAGELRFDGTTPDLAVLARMNQRLARRGPDGEGIWRDGAVAFAHRRLAIIDLTDRSKQPMRDERRGLTLVFNGTIYNYPQLRSELQQQGHTFVSDGDTEVILRAYAAWGEACVERLHGAFAFAIWDAQKKKLFLGRDRLGIKPLYFASSTKFFRFASTPQALLAGSDIDTSLDPIALHHQFTLHSAVPAPHTVLKGIRKVAQASTLSVSPNGERSAQSYWSLHAQRPSLPRTEQEWTSTIHDALQAAVKKRLEIADVKVGVLLSGGLDSSLLVALLAEHGVADLMTFSVGFDDQPEEQGNEFEYSDLVARHFGTRHHKFSIPNREVLHRLPEAVDCMSEPMVSQDNIAFYLLAEQVAQSVKVVQSGQGADEVFGGYYWHQTLAGDHEGSAVDRVRRHYFDRDDEEFGRMISPAFRSADASSALLDKVLTAPFADTFIDQVLRAETTLLVTDDPVKRVDNMTMAWGLEARVPFLDHLLVEQAAQMPPELKLASGGKHVLKQIARDLLPGNIIDRKKGYFPVPALKYVRGDFLEFVRDILDSAACRNRDVFQRSYVEQLLAEPERHLTRIQGSKLWHLALFEYWMQRNVDGRPA